MKNGQNVVELSETIKSREEMLLPDFPELPNEVESVIPMNQSPVTVDKTKTTNTGVSAADCNTCVLEAIGLAQAYVPYQPDGKTMGLEQSLVCGTAFPGLVKPYVSGMNLKRFQ